jgi:segregation and condensation protein B
MDVQMTLDAKIESILFFKAEPVKISSLAEIFSVSKDEVEEALSLLQQKLGSRGICPIFKDDEVTLGTAPEMSEMIEKISKEEMTRDLGKAALETLTIVLYKSPVARSEIDYIRGVNSSFILRGLQARGLVERVSGDNGSSAFLYRPTFDSLSHLGIARLEDLPEYGEFRTRTDESLEEYQTKNETL